MPNIRIDGDEPLTIDDLRREPGRLLGPADLARLGIYRSHGAWKKACQDGRLAEPYRLPNGRPRWEARAVLAMLGAPAAIPDQKDAA